MSTSKKPSQKRVNQRTANPDLKKNAKNQEKNTKRLCKLKAISKKLSHIFEEIPLEDYSFLPEDIQDFIRVEKTRFSILEESIRDDDNGVAESLANHYQEYTTIETDTLLSMFLDTIKLRKYIEKLSNIDMSEGLVCMSFNKRKRVD